MEKLPRKTEQGDLIDHFVKSDNLLDDVCEIIESSRKTAYQAINIALVQRNWLLGRRIASEEMQGSDRAAYGTEQITVSYTHLRAHET